MMERWWRGSTTTTTPGRLRSARLTTLPSKLIQYHPTKSPLRQGSYRGLAATANHFARESHMDALAHAAKMDPVAFRMKNLSNPRIKAVLQAAADKFGWAPPNPHRAGLRHRLRN